MKKYILCIIGIGAVILNGCSKSNMDLVKNGIMESHKSLTIGEAFGKWKICDQQKSGWQELKTDNGVDIIQYKCITNDPDKLSSILAKDEEELYQLNLKDKEASLQAANNNLKTEQNSSTSEFVKQTHIEFIQKSIKNDEDSIKEIEARHQEYASISKIIQVSYVYNWVVNRDKTFELTTAEVHYTWSDRVYVLNDDITDGKPLDKVYENRNPIDNILKISSPVDIATLLNSFYSAYNKAKVN